MAGLVKDLFLTGTRFYIPFIFTTWIQPEEETFVWDRAEPLNLRISTVYTCDLKNLSLLPVKNKDRI